MDDLSNVLEAIAAWFSFLGVPEPIVHWGHPLMMAIVVFVMGSSLGLAVIKWRYAHSMLIWAVQHFVFYFCMLYWG